MKHKACCCITFMRSDSTEEPSGHKLTRTVAAFVWYFSECDAMSFVNSFFFFSRAEQDQSDCSGVHGGPARSDDWLGLKGQIQQKECFRGLLFVVYWV